MKSAELIDLARSLLVSDDQLPAGTWSRATALVGRQALESALRELWAAREPGISQCSTRAQLLCLPSYLDDDGLAERAAWTWWALTQACHVHPYELPPTANELDVWLTTVEAVASGVAAAR